MVVLPQAVFPRCCLRVLGHHDAHHVSLTYYAQWSVSYSFILVSFGAGVDCQVVLSANTGVATSQKGSYLSISFGWAIGTAIGVWVAGASGGHINPVVRNPCFPARSRRWLTLVMILQVTLIQAIFRGFPWRKVPIYIMSQLCGACLGGLLVYSNYMHAIAIVDPGKTQATASLFTTYALDYMPSGSCTLCQQS